MTQILVLNQTYEPLSVVSPKRAVLLVMKNRARPATEETIKLTSGHGCMEIPTVLVLKKYVNAPKRGARWSRRAVLERDNYTCAYCGLGIGSRQGSHILTARDFTIDHVVPQVAGGKNTWTNTICACAKCNHRKGGRTPGQANMTLLFEPKIPRVTYFVARGTIPKSWKIYLESK